MPSNKKARAAKDYKKQQKDAIKRTHHNQNMVPSGMMYGGVVLSRPSLARYGGGGSGRMGNNRDNRGYLLHQ